MQLVIKNSQVIATHKDGQDLGGKYHGCIVVAYAGDYKLTEDGKNPDPRTEEEKLVEYQDQRRLEYPSKDDLMVALWEKTVEGRTDEDSGVEDLQALREAVKIKYPK